MVYRNENTNGAVGPKAIKEITPDAIAAKPRMPSVRLPIARTGWLTVRDMIDPLGWNYNRF